MCHFSLRRIGSLNYGGRSHPNRLPLTSIAERSQASLRASKEAKTRLNANPRTSQEITHPRQEAEAIALKLYRKVVDAVAGLPFFDREQDCTDQPLCWIMWIAMPAARFVSVRREVSRTLDRVRNERQKSLLLREVARLTIERSKLLLRRKSTAKPA